MVREAWTEIVLRIAPVHQEAVCVVEQLAYRSAGELTADRAGATSREWLGGVSAAD